MVSVESKRPMSCRGCCGKGNFAVAEIHHDEGMLVVGTHPKGMSFGAVGVVGWKRLRSGQVGKDGRAFEQGGLVGWRTVMAAATKAERELLPG